MHRVTIRQNILDRLVARRGRVHRFERLDAKRSALAVVDMQSMFCEPGAPGEVQASRGIVEPISPSR